MDDLKVPVAAMLPALQGTVVRLKTLNAVKLVAAVDGIRGKGTCTVAPTLPLRSRLNCIVLSFNTP